MKTEGLTPQGALRARRRAAGFVEVTLWAPAEFRGALVEFARELLNRAALAGHPMPGDGIGEFLAAAKK